MAKRQEVLRWGEQQLREAGIVDWRTDSWLLYESAAHMNRTEFLLHSIENMPASELGVYENMVKRRCTHVPVQYITGEQEFMGYSFLVNEQVLIPRMDTEILVQTVEQCTKQAARVLDLCTGSGCIAVSLKKRNPQFQIMGTDISKEAIEIAYKNSRRMEVTVDFYVSDLFGYFQQIEQERLADTAIFPNGKIKFDRIVSNPPYIPTSVINGLDEEVRCHEPRIALDGTEDGLGFYRRITRESRNYLTDQGMLFYEIGYDQAEAVSDIMEAEGFGNITVIQDLAGLDRVVYGGMEHV